MTAWWPSCTDCNNCSKCCWGNTSLSFPPGLWPPHKKDSQCCYSSWGSFICGTGHKSIRAILYIVIVGARSYCPWRLLHAPDASSAATNDVVCQHWTQNPGFACRDQSRSSNLRWLIEKINLINSEFLGLDIFRVSLHLKLRAYIGRTDAKFLLLWIILLDPPGNISWNRILPNTLRIIMPPATLLVSNQGQRVYCCQASA